MSLTFNTKYDERNAAFLADCAAAAYAKETSRLGVLRNLGLAEPISLDVPRTDIHGYVTQTADGQVLLTFKGTDSVNNWLTDARFLPTMGEFKGEQLHAGFEAAWRSIRTITLSAMPTDHRPIWITGHSLGGALAVLAADAIERAGGNIAAVYTFGCPRVGNPTWAQRYNEKLGTRTWRVVDKEDPVPHLPPAAVFTFAPPALNHYRHVGQEVFFDEFGMTELNPPLWRELLSDAYGIWRSWSARELALVPDHFINNYQNLFKS